MAVKEAVLTSAVDLARKAAQEVAELPDLVGEHLGTELEGERLVAHRFASTARGYRGWHWTVTVARVPRGRVATVCEVELLPGPDAILAPAWVPWSERLRPGDVGAGDVLPFQSDDERLDPGYAATGDVDDDRIAVVELGLGRERVLSREGRSLAADRWYTGPNGPTAPVAVTAEQPCSTCGFLVLMAGSMRTLFGVCANEWSPDDGRVVSMDHGCGAHSQTDVPNLHSDWPAPTPVVGETDLEIIRPDPDADADADLSAVEPVAVAEPVEAVEPVEGEVLVEAVEPAEAPEADQALEAPEADRAPGVPEAADALDAPDPG